MVSQLLQANAAVVLQLHICEFARQLSGWWLCESHSQALHSDRRWHRSQRLHGLAISYISTMNKPGCFPNTNRTGFFFSRKRLITKFQIEVKSSHWLGYLVKRITVESRKPGFIIDSADESFCNSRWATYCLFACNPPYKPKKKSKKINILPQPLHLPSVLRYPGERQ